jgi:glutamyl-tRNA synthetase
MREKAQENKQPPRYDGRWRDADPATGPEGVLPAIRIKAPQTGEIIVHDKVQGDVTFRAENLDDFIILRSDGTPTYMLAVVVDDHDMEITHIIRGDDHLTNAARQIVIFEAMGWDVPEMTHVPLIHGADGAKLSKRHGALGVDAYRKMGYLPEAVCNYLARLGWSHGNDEFFSITQLIDWFSLDGLNKGASRFDFVKLESLNAQHIRAANPGYLYDQMLALMIELDRHEDVAGLTGHKETVLAAMPDLQLRAKTILELVTLGSFIYAQRPLEIDEKASKHLNQDTREMIGRVIARLEMLEDWTAANLNEVVRAFGEESDLKLGKVAQPLRAALTGRTISPGVFEIMALLGKNESLDRLGDQAKD